MKPIMYMWSGVQSILWKGNNTKFYSYKYFNNRTNTKYYFVAY